MPLSRVLLRLMIKQIAKAKLKLIFWAVLVFFIGIILQVNLVIPAFLLSLYLYAKLRRFNIRNYNLLNITLLFLIIFVASYFIIRQARRQEILLLYIPFSAVPMLSALLFNNMELSLLITLAASVSIAAISGYPFSLLLVSLISGLLSIIIVQGAKKRKAIIRAGLIIGIAQAATLFFIEYFRMGSLDRYLVIIINGVACGIIVAGILPVFEYLFKTLTNISLLELTDTPLLNRMKLEAPGTSHHSLIVGNLSETACETVGANALLARVGAYYHDIGKLSKPEYFSENQGLNSSKHDILSPVMSKLIIMNHVKEGVEVARKYKLNPVLIDFIQQHHGNSLVYYFYQRALENIEEDQEVKEEGFRYPGPKPDTKEAAIVLLADSVEAAARALKDPHPKKIEEVVHKVINNKFIDGQLDECDLTLKDLEKISAVFIRILSGIYHSRVTYAKETKSENNHNKSPKENSYQSKKDKESNS